MAVETNKYLNLSSGKYVKEEYTDNKFTLY